MMGLNVFNLTVKYQIWKLKWVWTYLDIIKRHNVFMLQLLMKNREKKKKANASAGEKRTAFAKSPSNTDYSDNVLLGLWGMSGAHLEDFDLLAKKDLRLGQVLLVDALDGHLPVCLLHSRRTRTRGWKQISKTFTTSVCWLANLKCHFWERKKKHTENICSGK